MFRSSGAFHARFAELKSSVSFDAARRAVSEAKAHAKAKAAALLQASSASWADKLHAAKADRAALQVQLEQLQQEHQQLQQQVRHVCI
jgi:seryl-tRNA synthetase